MKVKFSVIPFALATIAMFFFRIMSLVGVDESGNFLGMDRMALSYTTIGIAIALFIVCILINIFDRKTAPVYPVKKNLLAGALAILSGITVLVASVASFAETTADSEYYMMSIISMVFSLPAAIAFGLMSRVHFTGKSTVSSASIMFVFPALWGCTELVFEFLNATKVSISATDLTGLFCYIFITLYYFSHSMVVSRIKGRNPVKACFIYGLPAVALTLTHGVYSIMLYFREGMGYSSICTAVQFIILGLYALSFIIEMTINSYTKDQLEIVEDLPDADSTEEEDKYIETKEYDDLVFSSTASSTDTEVDPAEDYYSSAKGLDDFVMNLEKKNEEDDESEMPKDGEDYLIEKFPESDSDDKKSKIPFFNSTKKDNDATLEAYANALPKKKRKVAPAVNEEPEAAEEIAAEPAEEPAAQLDPDIEVELRKLSQSDVSSVDEPEEAPVERVKTSDDKDIEAEENARLSDIDKLLQELDSKTE